MQSYRLYVFDARVRSLDTHEFNAADDDRAASLAEDRHGHTQMELWAGRRQVRCWGPPRCANALAA